MSPLTIRTRYRILPETAWAQVRRLYEEGRSPADLCRQYGISRSTFFSRRRREGWVRIEQVDTGLSPSSLADGQGGFVGPDALSGREHGGGNQQGDSQSEQLRAGARGSLSPDLARQCELFGRHVSDEHMRMARDLRHRIDMLTADQRLGAGPQGRRSRAAVDLATAIEKVQKVERTALGLDKGPQRPIRNVVIVVPPKMAEDDWVSEGEEVLADDRLPPDFRDRE